MLVSIIIPCYNESPNIAKLLNCFSKLRYNDGRIEIILVDNGSTDNTAETLSGLAISYSFLRVVTVERNEGYGNGILQGISAARGDYIAWMHADMQTSPEEFDYIIDDLTRRGTPRKIFYKGLRKSRPWSDTFFTLCMGFYESVHLGTWLFDINAQPTLFSKELLNDCKNPPKDFSLDLYVYYCAKKCGFLLVRYPVMQFKREFGASSWNTGLVSRAKLIKRVVAYTAILKKNFQEEKI